MNCLIDFIGVRGAGLPSAESDMYINDLPGITLVQLSAINNSDQANFAELYATIQRRAARIFETAFTNAMSKKYRLKKITEGFVLSSAVDETTTYAPVTGELRGIYMDCFIGRSAFHHIPVSTIRIYLTAPANFDLKIYGVYENELSELDTFPVTGVSGWNTIKVNRKYYDSKTLFIAYDASSITSASIPLDSNDLNPYLADSLAQFFSHIFINGATYSEGTFTSEPMDSFGLTATLSLQCSYDVLVCNFKSNLAVAWWYLLGSELMKERIYTDRVNRYTTVDLDKARELMKSLHDDYMNELLTFVDSIDLSRDWCIDCDALLRQVEFLP